MNTIKRLLKRRMQIAAVSRLGSTPKDRRRLAWRGLRLFVADGRRRTTRAGDTDFEATIKHHGRIGKARIAAFSDYFTIWELFCLDEYDIIGSRSIGHTGTILDLGSNVGYSLLYFRMRFPGARIIGVEPDPANYERLVRQSASLGNTEVIPDAVAGESGSMVFYSDAHRGQSSSLRRRDHRQAEVRVPVKTLDELIENLELDRIDLLKFDIEGAEMDAFRAFTHWDRVAVFLGELHTDAGSWTVADMVRLFEPTHEVTTTEMAPDRHLMLASRREA